MLTSPVSQRPTPNQAKAILSRADDPVWFAEHVLGHDPWDVPRRIMRSVARPNSRTAVKACHASAKTFTAAEIVIWFALQKRGIAVTTAPTWFQVEKLLWAEVHKAHASARHPLGGTLNGTEFKLAPDCYAVGLSTNESVRFQGFHAGENSALLFVLDEAPGVRPDIYEAIEGARAGGDVRTLMLGNPTITGGPFQSAFDRERALWDVYTIDALDTPNLQGVSLDDLRAIPFGKDGVLTPEHEQFLAVSPRPYLTTRRWVWEKLHTWGEQSPLWEARVRGQFPTQSEDALIALAWLERAKRQPAEASDEPFVAGLDVAGPGEDETVLTVRQGGRVVARFVWSLPDPRGEVVGALRSFEPMSRVNVDSIGIGYYMARHLEDAGFTVVDINVGESARDTEKYSNLKAELYWGLRLRFEDDDICGIDDDLTISQLAGIKYEHNARGQVVIESKEKARKRGVTSPDRAESLMLAFAEVGVSGDLLVGW